MATFDDISQLSNLYQQSFSPVTNYSQGLLALAMKQRERANQVADTQQQQAFTLQRDQAQAALQERLEKSAQTAATDRLKLTWQHADAEEKDRMLRDLRAQARQMELPMPAASLSKDEQADYLNTAIGADHGKKALNLINSSRKLQEQYSQETGTDPRERLQHQMDVLLANPASLVLTPQERINLKRDPSSLASITARLQRDKSSKGKAAADDFLLASSTASESTDLFYAKYAKNPERVAQIVGDLGLIRQAMIPILQNPNLPSGLYADIFSSVGSTSKQIQAEQQPDRFALPAPDRTAPGPSAQVPQGASPFEDFYYNQQPPAPGLLAPSSNVNAPVLNIQPRAVAPVAPPSTLGSVPGASVDPSVLATLRYRKFMQDSAASSNALFPTAFPASNQVFSPAATAP